MKLEKGVLVMLSEEWGSHIGKVSGTKVIERVRYWE